MTISKQQAVNLLVQLFDNNKLSFRDIQVVKSCFDTAVEACNEARSEAIASWHMGRSAKPLLPDSDAEDNFWYTLQVEAASKLQQKGIKANDKAIAAIAEVAADIAEFDVEDML